MKITTQPQQQFVRHHEVGKVYKNFVGNYVLIAKDAKTKAYRRIFLENGAMSGELYSSLENIDEDFGNDILVDAELVIKE